MSGESHSSFKFHIYVGVGYVGVGSPQNCRHIFELSTLRDYIMLLYIKDVWFLSVQYYKTVLGCVKVLWFRHQKKFKMPTLTIVFTKALDIFLSRIWAALIMIISRCNWSCKFRVKGCAFHRNINDVDSKRSDNEFVLFIYFGQAP